MVAILRLGKCIPSDDADFPLHVLDALEEYQTIAVAEILVHRANLAAEGAVDGHAQGSGLSIHRTAATDHQIGMPNQIQAIDDLMWDAYLPICEKSRPMIPQMSSLLIIPRKHDDLYLRPTA